MQSYDTCMKDGIESIYLDLSLAHTKVVGLAGYKHETVNIALHRQLSSK
jgi:hypothetical protein